MSFEYNSRRDSLEVGLPMKGNNNTSLPPAPSVFQPPHPPLRHGNHNQHDTSPPSHYNNPGMRTDGHFKTSPLRYHQNHPDETDVDNRSQDGRYMQPHSPRHMHALPADKQHFHKKTPFLTSGKGGSFDPYQRQDDTRHPAEALRVNERGGDTRGKRGDKHVVDEGHYPYSRDGPSPGRGYARSDDFQQQSGIEQSFPSSQHPGGNMYQNPHTKKRKSHDPPVMDGPRLISHQSSDDDINGLVQKRARNGNAMPADPSTLMKSFTPLSPMHSRSFSRDDAIDITRFAPRTADNYRIFQSWSSGNSNSGSHSPSDVRLCYDDWQQPDPNGRAPGNSRSWEEKVMASREEISNKERDNGLNGHYHGSNKHPSSFNPKPSRNGGGHQQRWPSPPSHEKHLNQRPTRYENQGPEKNMLPPTNSRNHCQVLHPEDRCGPYQNQLSHHVNPAAQYGRVMDVGRSFWRGQPVPHMQYNSQRRDDIEDRSKMTHIRGRPASPTSRLSAPTPPVTNGYGRFGNEFHHPNMYDMPMSRGSRPPYEPWVNRARPFGAAPYHHGTGQSNESRESADGYNRPYSSRCSHLQSVKIESGPNGSSGMRTVDGILLLSLPEDRISLSETLCIVRENVEVFIATEADVKAPAPGRKRPVVEGQVGLRCIHCRSALHQSDKVKRAVCFPSSIKRIYRTVIDMKLDHFKACRFVPIELKMKLEELKATNARSTGTTMQYFVQAAKRMGMYDGTHGIRFSEKDSEGNIIGGKKEETSISVKVESGGDISPGGKSRCDKSSNSASDSATSKLDGAQSSVQGGVSFTLSLNLSTSGDSTDGSRKNSSSGKTKKEAKYHTGKVNLSLPEDKTALSPLRCFLRKNVYAFSATAEDIAVRTPTTFSVVLGQVGIGCIHCHSMRAKERSNRAVCFPFSIGRIYQSVADIQRFHLGECKMVPEPVRGKFLELQSASSKGSKGLATRQYWVTSAKKLGLVDSDNGIRFSRDPSIPLEKAFSLDILAQVASDVTTAAKPLVLPEDKPHIAGFLYVVMKQLQPCRFTEADRNKRRLKDVGCIGVECKHCAGQVDGRKFFWSSVSAVESNFVSVHTHMMECKIISDDMKTKLAHLKTLRKEQTARLKSGSQKAFFSRVWKRLHAEGDKVPSVNGQSSVCQVITSQPDKAKQSKPTMNVMVPVTPTMESTGKDASIHTPKDDNSLGMADNKPVTEDMPPLATYPSLESSSPDSSVTSSPNSFSYNAIKVEPSHDYSGPKTPDRPKTETGSFITPSMESPTPSTTEDMMMNRTFSSPSSIESVMPQTSKDVTLDPSIFSASASIESPRPASNVDVNMGNEVSDLLTIKEAHV